jgi:hypothetical protein
MINVGEVAALGVTPERVHEVAVENLRRRVQLEVTNRPPIIVVQTGEDLEACVLLLDPVWPQLAAHVSGEIVAGVPTRSTLFVAGSASSEGLALVRECMVQLHARDDEQLSRHLFVRRGMRWEVFE